MGEYTRLAYHINNASHEPEAVERAIARIGSLGREKEYHIDNVVESLRGSDCYNGWGRELRYLLYRYEEYLAGLAGVKINKNMWEAIWRSSTTSTIEHIRPQKWDAKGWKGVLGRTKEKVEIEVNRLGNLILLPLGLTEKQAISPFERRKRFIKWIITFYK